MGFKYIGDKHDSIIVKHYSESRYDTITDPYGKDIARIYPDGDIYVDGKKVGEFDK